MPLARTRPIRRRPVSREKLSNSIRYIKMRDRYLQDNGILVKTGKRSWKLNSR